MLIRTLVVTPFFQNARVLIDERTREAVVIDPGGDIGKFLPALLLDKEPVEVTKIFLTHSHIDHAGGVRQLQALLKEQQKSVPELLAHKNEQQFRATLSDTAVFFGLDPLDFENVPEPERYVDEGDEIKVGSTVGKLLFTPGHSPGHLSLYFPAAEIAHESFPGASKTTNAPVLIAGDVLFAGSIGRTDLPGGNLETLLRSVREKIFVLPPETIVLSGHGDNTTVGVEKSTNPFFQ